MTLSASSLLRHASALAPAALSLAALSLSASAAPPPAWGAIAATQGGYGYAYSQPSRSAAEVAAREQCEQALAKSRPGSPHGSCEIRTAFDRSCGAMAVGSYGEWGIATAASETAARQAAVGQCNTHLPTEPCRVTVGFCSPK